MDTLRDKLRKLSMRWSGHAYEEEIWRKKLNLYKQQSTIYIYIYIYIYWIKDWDWLVLRECQHVYFWVLRLGNRRFIFTLLCSLICFFFFLGARSYRIWIISKYNYMIHWLDTSTPGQSGSESNSNEGVLHIPLSSRTDPHHQALFRIIPKILIHEFHSIEKVNFAKRRLNEFCFVFRYGLHSLKLIFPSKNSVLHFFCEEIIGQRS